ncbi:MAG: PD-(D/E)XK nuclease family protein [Candidatus Hodarchaeales archaeon]|jgi:hypothetical protein
MNSSPLSKQLKDFLSKTTINRLEDPPDGVPRYKINNTPYFSVTQILDDGRFSGVDSIRMFHAKILGSVVHNFIDNFFKNKDLDYNQEKVLRPKENEFLNQLPAADESSWQDFKNGILEESEEMFLKNKIQTAFDQFMNFYEENDVELVIAEEAIWSPRFLYAGTIDLICKLNGHLAVVDHKTSKFIKTMPKGFDTYTAQLSAYHFALKDMLSENIESECYILHVNPFAKDYQIIRRSYKFSMFLDSLSRFSGGSPSEEYYLGRETYANGKGKPTNGKVSNNKFTDHSSTSKTIDFKCSEQGCNEVSTFNIIPLDLTLSDQNILLIPKCTYHEAGDHYHVLHVNTDSWKSQRSFTWLKD